MTESRSQGVVTILFTDVEGSTALRTSRGDDVAHALLTAQDTTVRNQIASHDGREVKCTGDGFMVAFGSARKAIGCALSIQQALADSEVRVRIGLNSGEATEQDGDLFGEAVNAAARIMAKAKGGEILVSEVVRQLAGTMPDLTFCDRGRFPLKGFPDRWRLYEIKTRGEAKLEPAIPEPPAITGSQPLSPIVGRSDEIGELRSLLEQAARGTGRLVIIDGEAGIGKTRLSRAAIDAAKDLGFQCFVGGAHELERDRPFGAVIDAFGLRPTAEDTARLAIVELLEDDQSQRDQRFAIIERLIELIQALATARPLFVLIEDLHWADSSSILTLNRLASTIPLLPVVVVCTTRPEPRSAELRSLINTLEKLGSSTLMIEPLGADAVAELAANTLDASPGPQLLEQLGGAAGNPLFVTELLAALRQEGLVATTEGTAEVGEVSMPPSLRLTILRRLSSLTEPALETLRIASVLGAEFSLTDLCTVAGKSVTTLVPLIEEAALTGLVAATGSLLRFRHELVRDAIYGDMLEPIRKALHAQAARALADAGATAPQIATHAAIGADVGDLQAADWLRKAAQEITPRAPIAALELLERALELVGNDRARRNEIRLTLAWSYAANERADKAADVARDILADCSDREIRSDAQRVRFQALPPDEAVAEIDKALHDPALSAAEQARLTAEKAVALRNFDSARAIAEADRAIALSTAAGDSVGLFLGTWVRAFCRGFEGHFDEAIRLWDEIDRLAADVREQDSRAVYGAGWRRMLLVWGDRFEEAEHGLEAVRSEGAEVGEIQTHGYHWAKSYLEAWAGRWDEAIAVAEAGASLAPDVAVTNYIQILAYIAIHRDELGAADSLIRKIPDAAWTPALLAEARGDSSELERILYHHRTVSMRDPRPWNYCVGLWTLPEWVRLHHAAGDLDSARALTEVIEDGVERAGTPTARGAALRCRGLCENDAEILRAAVEAYRTGPRPFDLAEACEWAAIAGDGMSVDESVELLEEALRIYESVGAVRDIARAEAHLRDRGVRRGVRGPRRRPQTGWESLTPSEERVTALVAEGLTYREIGDRLFISRRTVETHVVHVFNKLGLASRRELAELAVERGLPAHAVT